MPGDIEELQARIESLKTRSKPSNTSADSKPETGMHAGLELAGAIIGGTAIGYGLDLWLGTKPLFIMGMFFLGVATGFYNVYRLTNNISLAPGFSVLHKESKDAKNTTESARD